MTEAKKNRLLKKIDQLKKILRKEKATFGGYHDGRGYRYSIGELYFELGDFKKADEYLMRAYMLEGKKIFEGEEKKYLNHLQNHYIID